MLALQTSLLLYHIKRIRQHFRSILLGNMVVRDKLALPTIVKIANALSVSVDELLYDSMEQVKVVYDKKIAEELEDCDPAELQAFLEIIQSTKKVLRTNRKVTMTY